MELGRANLPKASTARVTGTSHGEHDTRVNGCANCRVGDCEGGQFISPVSVGTKVIYASASLAVKPGGVEDNFRQWFFINMDEEGDHLMAITGFSVGLWRLAKKVNVFRREEHCLMYG